MKRKKSSFNESYHGYRTFSDLLEDAEKEGIILLRTDSRSGTYVITGFGKEQRKGETKELKELKERETRKEQKTPKPRTAQKPHWRPRQRRPKTQTPAPTAAAPESAPPSETPAPSESTTSETEPVT